jgi:hypothetical protein
MADDNVIEFPSGSPGRSNVIVQDFGADEASLDAEALNPNAVTYVAGSALARAEDNFGGAMRLLRAAMVHLKELELQTKADRILGPSRGPGPEAA